MNRRFLVAAFLSLAFTSIASAQQGGDNPASIIAAQKAIRAEVIAKSNGWDAISKTEREKVIQNQDRIFQLLEAKQAGTELSQSEQVEVGNSLQWIDSIAKTAADERLICRRERPTGSNMPVRVCKTAGQMRVEREAAVKAMNSANSMSPGARP